MGYQGGGTERSAINESTIVSHRLTADRAPTLSANEKLKMEMFNCPKTRCPLSTASFYIFRHLHDACTRVYVTYVRARARLYQSFRRLFITGWNVSSKPSIFHLFLVYYNCDSFHLKVAWAATLTRDNEIGSNFRLKKKEKRKKGCMERGWNDEGGKPAIDQALRKRSIRSYIRVYSFFISRCFPISPRTRSRIHSSRIYSYSFPDNGWGITVVHRDK